MTMPAAPLLPLSTTRTQRDWWHAAKQPFAHITPRCQYVGTCGGCTLQDLSYADQLALKQRFVQDAMRPFGITEIPVMPMDEPWRYRNKIELSFGRSHEAPALGFHESGSFWKVVDIEECWLMPASFAPIIATIREAVRRSGLSTYDAKQHRGFWRHVVMRISRLTQQVLVCLMTDEGPRAAVEQVVAACHRAHPEVVTWYWGINRQLADVAEPEELHLMEGPAYVRERIGTLTMDLHPLTFLQPSLEQAERMYGAIAQWAQRRGARQVWDLYAGIGCIGMSLAATGAHVLCLESDPQNVALLTHNAQLNQLPIEVYAGAVESSVRALEARPAPDCIVVDPPRGGLHKYALRALAVQQPRSFAYLSCNMATLLPNLQQLLTLCPSYRIAGVQAFDMFPQTTHVETLVLLELAS